MKHKESIEYKLSRDHGSDFGLMPFVWLILGGSLVLAASAGHSPIDVIRGICSVLKVITHLSQS